MRGRIATELDVVPTALMPTSDGARFERDGLGGVAWGGVTGIGAAGRTAAGEVRVVGDTLELVLPARFIAEASYPMVLDPLIGTSFDLNNTVFDDNYPDIAYDVTENVYLVAWQRTFSQTSIAVRAQRVTSTGGPVGSLISVSDPDRLASTPSVGNVNTSNRFLVAWRERVDPLAIGDIAAAAVDADDGDVSATLVLAPSAGQQMYPDVGGERTLVDNDAVVVWRDQSLGIRMCQVTVPVVGGIFLPAGVVTLASNSGTVQQRYPAISQSSGDSGYFAVAWESMDTAGTSTAAGTGSIRARIVDRNANPIGMEVDVSVINTRSNERPAVDGDGTNWVFTWQRQEVFYPSKYDVMTRAGSMVGGSLDFNWSPHYLESDIDDHEFGPQVAWVGNRAIVAYVDEAGNTDELWLSGVDPYTGHLGEGPLYVSTWAGSIWHIGVASGWSGAATGPPADDAFVVFGHVPNGAPDGDIRAVRYDAPGSPVNLGGGTLRGGLNVNPMAHEGNANFRAYLRGGPPNALTLFVLSSSTAPFACGTSTWFPSLAPGRKLVSRVTDAQGNASVQAPLPLGTAGLQSYSQWATSSPNAAGCPTAKSFAFSNGLHLTIEP